MDRLQDHGERRKDSKMEDVKAFWTQRELMERWGCGRTYLWELRRDRTGPRTVVIAGRVLYPIESVLRWEEEQLARHAR